MAAIYIAARFSRRAEANALANELQARGHTITSRWVLPHVDHVMPTGLSAQAEDAERCRFATEDMEDVRACDCMVSLMEEPRSNGRGGRHVEYGAALALDKGLVIIGPRETVFHHLPQVAHFETTDNFLRMLDAGLALSAKRRGFLHARTFATRWGVGLAFIDTDDEQDREVLALQVWAPLCEDGSDATVRMSIGLPGSASMDAHDLMSEANRTALVEMTPQRFEAALETAGIAATLDEAYARKEGTTSA